MLLIFQSFPSIKIVLFILNTHSKSGLKIFKNFMPVFRLEKDFDFSTPFFHFIIPIVQFYISIIQNSSLAGPTWKLISIFQIENKKELNIIFIFSSQKSRKNFPFTTQLFPFIHKNWLSFFKRTVEVLYKTHNSFLVYFIGNIRWIKIFIKHSLSDMTIKFFLLIEYHKLGDPIIR